MSQFLIFYQLIRYKEWQGRWFCCWDTYFEHITLFQVVNGYFVHYFAPQGLPRMKRKVLFILDYSGSMLGTKITQLKTAMSEILSNLAKGDRFNIIRFNGDVTKWWNHSALVEVNEYSVNAAKNFINDIEADGCKLSSADLKMLSVAQVWVVWMA